MISSLCIPYLWLVFPVDVASYVLIMCSPEDGVHYLQMQHQSNKVHTFLVMESVQFSWIMWAAEGMRQTLMIVPTTYLASITVGIMKMQESSVYKVQLCVCVCADLTSTHVNMCTL